MNLENLKKQWDLEQNPKSGDEIRQAIAQKSKSASVHTRRKVLIEAAAFAVLLLVFFTGLDPERNSLWVNIFLALMILTGIVNNLMIYRRLIINKQGESLALALERQIRWQWKQLQFSVLFSVLFFSAVFAFLLSGANINGPKFWIVMLVFGLSVVLRSWFEISRWKHNIQQLTLCQLELNAEERSG